MKNPFRKFIAMFKRWVLKYPRSMWLGAAIIVSYALIMGIVPIFRNNGNLTLILSTWDRWQSLSVGVLAFSSSLLAFGISRYNADRQRERDFIAARSFLPEVFSELTGYCGESMVVFEEVWKQVKAVPPNRTPLKSKNPVLPKRYRQVFSDCIRVAEPEVGKRLSLILMELQINNSRLMELFENDTANEGTVWHVGLNYIHSLFYLSAEIQALINTTFQYARGLDDKFEARSLDWRDYRYALRAHDIYVEDFEGLQTYIEENISAENAHDKA